MFSAAKFVVRDHYLAEDVVQEAFERIIKKIHLVRKVKRNALRSYTVLITRSIACNLVRKESKYKTIPIVDADFFLDSGDTSIEETVGQKETVQVIKECLGQMGDNYAAPLILRYYYGYSNQETAELLHINSSGTIRSLCSRGRRIIQDKIAKAGDLHE